MQRVGVLALQGAVSEHLKALAAVGLTGLPVRKAAELDGLDGLILPGGESTVLSRLIRQDGLHAPIQAFAAEKPLMGTCAGLILCASSISPSPQQADEPAAGKEHEGHKGHEGHEGHGCPPSRPRVEPLALLPIGVARNGFGRQVDSFESLLDVEGIGPDIPALFIRAPYIETAGPEVRILASVDGKAVMAQHGHILVMAFHPELTDDLRIMEHFSRMA